MKRIQLLLISVGMCFSIKAQHIRPTLDQLRNVLLDGNYNPQYVLLAVHRACWIDGCPENSTEAVQAAIDNPEVDMIEVDVKVSSDIIAYLLHDNYLQRTTNFLDLYPGIYGTGLADDDFGLYDNYTWSELSGLRLKNPDNVYTNSRLPLLSDIIKLVKDKNIILQLDISDDIIFDEAFAVVQYMDAFKFVMFKGTFTIDRFLNFFNDLTEEQKKQVIYAPFIGPNTQPAVPNPNASGPTGFYLEWKNWSLAHPEYKGIGKLFEMTYTSAQDIIAINTAVRIRTEGGRLGVFAAQPEYYRGKFYGGTNIDQCCYDNAATDRRGDWEFILNPAGRSSGGINGYIITDETKPFLEFFPNRAIQ